MRVQADCRMTLKNPDRTVYKPNLHVHSRLMLNLATLLVLVAITGAQAQVRPQIPEPMVCSGRLSPESRVEGPGPPQYMSFIMGRRDHTCAFLSGTKTADTIFEKCKPGETCTVQAMVIRNGSPQIVRVVWVLKGSLDDIDCDSPPPEWLKYCEGAE